MMSRKTHVNKRSITKEHNTDKCIHKCYALYSSALVLKLVQCKNSRVEFTYPDKMCYFISDLDFKYSLI